MATALELDKPKLETGPKPPEAGKEASEVSAEEMARLLEMGNNAISANGRRVESLETEIPQVLAESNAGALEKGETDRLLAEVRSSQEAVEQTIQALTEQIPDKAEVTVVDLGKEPEVESEEDLEREMMRLMHQEQGAPAEVSAGLAMPEAKEPEVAPTPEPEKAESDREKPEPKIEPAPTPEPKEERAGEALEKSTQELIINQLHQTWSADKLKAFVFLHEDEAARLAAKPEDLQSRLREFKDALRDMTERAASGKLKDTQIEGAQAVLGAEGKTYLIEQAQNKKDQWLLWRVKENGEFDQIQTDNKTVDVFDTKKVKELLGY